MSQPEEVREAMAAAVRQVGQEKLLHVLTMLGQADIKGDASPLELEIAVLRALSAPKPVVVAAAGAPDAGAAQRPYGQQGGGRPAPGPAQRQPPGPPQPEAAAADSAPRPRQDLTPDQEKWRNVWDGLRRTKFRRWVLGPVLSNVIPPEPADGKITLRFKSRSMRERFMEEMDDPRAREALRTAIDREYGGALKLEVASPADEAEAAKEKASAASESPLVRAAMVMGATVVSEEDAEE